MPSGPAGLPRWRARRLAAAGVRLAAVYVRLAAAGVPLAAAYEKTPRPDGVRASGF